VHPRLVTYLELTERDTWEALRSDPVLTKQQSFNEGNTVKMVVVGEHHVQQEQLPDGVYDIGGFDDEIGSYEIVTVQPTADDAAHLG